ncbi:RICIN domain-containing protein [Actinoplanes sp. CA-030573]|uniref:RICIN domain-containing protein n=1 Tax=Actinoplanes sp. CA-030573 TaxID=3239898 RepID=UPI003D8EF338
MRIGRMLGTSSALALLVTLAVQAPARADDALADGGFFEIYSYAHADKRMAVNGGQTQNGAKIIQYHILNTPDATRPITDQSWILRKNGDYWNIQNDKSGKVVAIPNGRTDAGAGAIQYDRTASLWDQQWEFLSYANHHGWMLKNRKSGLCLAVPGSSGNDGVQLIQYGCHKEYDDQWWWVDRFYP